MLKHTLKCDLSAILATVSTRLNCVKQRGLGLFAGKETDAEGLSTFMLDFLPMQKATSVQQVKASTGCTAGFSPSAEVELGSQLNLNLNQNHQTWGITNV